MSDSNRRGPFNPVLRPIPPQPQIPGAPGMVYVAVDPRTLFPNALPPGNIYSGSAPRVDNGFRRFVQCADCNKAAKLYVCYANSNEACGRNDKKDTHTHIKCECNGGRDIVLNGNVQFRTRLDKAPVQQ